MINKIVPLIFITSLMCQHCIAADNLSVNNLTVAGNVSVGETITANDVEAHRAVETKSLIVDDGLLAVQGAGLVNIIECAPNGEVTANSIAIDDRRGTEIINMQGNTGTVTSRSLAIKDKSHTARASMASDGSVKGTSLTIKDNMNRKSLVVRGSDGIMKTNLFQTTTLRLNKSFMGNLYVPSGENSFSLEVKYLKDNGTEGYQFRGGNYPISLCKITLVQVDTGKVIESFYIIDAANNNDDDNKAKENNQFLGAISLIMGSALFDANLATEQLVSVQEAQYEAAQMDVAIELIGMLAALKNAVSPDIFTAPFSPVAEPAKWERALDVGIVLGKLGSSIYGLISLILAIENTYVTFLENSTENTDLVIGTATPVTPFVASTTEGDDPLAATASVELSALINAYNEAKRLCVEAKDAISAINIQAIANFALNRPGQMTTLVNDRINSGDYDPDEDAGTQHPVAQDLQENFFGPLSGWEQVITNGKTIIADAATDSAADVTTIGGDLAGDADQATVLAAIATLIPLVKNVGGFLNTAVTTYQDMVQANRDAADFADDPSPSDQITENEGDLLTDLSDLVEDTNTAAATAETALTNVEINDSDLGQFLDAKEDLLDDVESQLNILRRSVSTLQSFGELETKINAIVNEIATTFPMVGGASITKNDVNGTVTYSFTPQNFAGGGPYRVFYQIYDRGVLNVTTS